jgi:transposase-like protein
MTKLKYTPEIRERAVQLLIESEKDYPSTWAAITAIAPKMVVLLKHFVPGIKSI